MVEGMFSEEGRKDFDSTDVRFTCREDCIYIIPMQQHGEDVIVKIMGEESKDFHGIITEFSVLGYDQKPVYTREADKMIIHAPFVDSDKPVVYRMRLK